MPSTRVIAILTAVLVGFVGTTGCGSSDSSVQPATTVESTTTPAGGMVSANDASIAELTAAFAAAGVANPERWAFEVDEYRPYSDDPSFGKLRDELAKYNPSPETLEAIIAALEP